MDTVIYRTALQYPGINGDYPTFQTSYLMDCLELFRRPS